MATITLGKVKFEFKGKYSAGTTYYADDVVVYDHMKFIYVNATSGSGNAPLILDTTHGWDNAFPNANPDNENSLKKWRLNKSYWEYFETDNHFGEYLGTWSAATNYEVGDVVTGTYGACYYAVKKSINDLPEINIYGSWQLLIEGGMVNHSRKISRLGPHREPVGWRGNPQFRTISQWTAVGGSAWNGNIPWNLSAAETDERWIGDVSNGQAGLRHIGWDGSLLHSGAGFAYSLPDMYSNSSAGATYLPVEYPMFFGQHYQAMLMSAGTYQGGQTQKLGEESATRQDIDYHISTAIDDQLSEPFASSYPRVIQVQLLGYGGQVILYSDGSVQISGVMSYLNMSGDGNVYHSQGYTLGRSYFGGRRIIKVATSQGDIHYQNQNADRVFYLDEEGDIWVHGYTNNGQLGLGPEYDELNSETAFTIGNRIAGIQDGGGFGTDATSYNVTGPINISTGDAYFAGNKIVDIWAGGHNYCLAFALDETGRLWSWGYNGYGQLGHATATGARTTAWSYAPREVGGINQTLNWADYNGIQKFWLVGYEQYTTCYLLDGDGYLWTWGYQGGDSRLGTASTYNNTNVLNATDHKRTAWANLSDGTIKNFWVTGAQTTTGVNVWLKKTDNTLWAFGHNGFYQLLDGTATNAAAPVSVDTGLSGNVYKITGSGAFNSSRTNFFCLTSTGEVFTIPNNQYPTGYGGVAGGLNNNYHPQQLVGESQYSWKRMRMGRGLHTATIKDIRSNFAYATVDGSNHSQYYVDIQTEDGRLYSIWYAGGGAHMYGGHYSSYADCGFTNQLHWGS